jgi:hypothetical protein
MTTILLTEQQHHFVLVSLSFILTSTKIFQESFNCFATMIGKNKCNAMKFLSSILLATTGSVGAFLPSHKNAVLPRTNKVEMGLWGEPNPKDGESGDRSQALPFAPRPKLLDGTLAGDVGFE